MFTELEYQEAMKQWPEIIPETLEYRLHYDEHGQIYLCTMQQHPDDTQYLVVDKDLYSNYWRYEIVDGKPKIIDKPTGYHVQLKSSDSGYRVVKNHAGVLLETETHHNVEYYDTNS